MSRNIFAIIIKFISSFVKLQFTAKQPASTASQKRVPEPRITRLQGLLDYKGY